MNQKHELIIDQFPLYPYCQKSKRFILHQMTLHIEKKIIYHHYQSEYRKIPSTLRATKSEKVTLVVFVDFSKAFHTIDFNILTHNFYSLQFSKNFLLSHFKVFIKQKPFCTYRFILF